MGTSGSTDFLLDRNGIIEKAFSILKIGAEGEDLTNDQIVRGSEALNIMVKEWQTEVDLFIQTFGTLTLTTAFSYTMGLGGDFTVRPLRILAMNFKLNGIETPMETMSRQEYIDLPDKASKGTPTQYYYDPQLTIGTLFIWPAPVTATGTLEFDFARPLDDFDASTDDPDFPQEWLKALVYNLAESLADEYGGLTNHIITMAALSKTRISMWDEEGESVFLQAEIR